MAIKNRIDWKELFLTPYEDSSKAVSECPNKQYFNHQCYPEELDLIPVELRHAKGYFFDDEIDKSNAPDVKYVRARQVDFERPNPWDMEGCEHMTDAQLFKKRMLDGKVAPFILPEFDLPNLEKVNGDVFIRGVKRDTLAVMNLKETTGILMVFDCNCNFDSLEKVDRLDVTGSDVSFHALSSVNDMRIASESDVSCSNLTHVDSISVYDSSLECPYLKYVKELSYHNSGSLNTLEFPRLERLGDLKFWVNPEFHVGKYDRPGDIKFPSLKTVNGYIDVRGKQGLVCGSLESALGLLFHSDGVLSMPSLVQVGKDYGDRGVFGCLELSGNARVDLSSLKDVFGDFELCNGVHALLDALEKVHGSLNVNCGHWISVGSNGTDRHPVTDTSVRTFRLDSLTEVRSSLSVYDNTNLQVPKLNKVGGMLNVYKNSFIKSDRVFTAARVGKKLSNVCVKSLERKGIGI